MRRALRWFLIVVIMLHGLIHLLGVGQLSHPGTVAQGTTWLAAAALVLAAGVTVALRSSYWWEVTAVAAVASQAVIFTAWGDANAGTIANVIMLGAAGYGYASQGPRSHLAEYRNAVQDALGDPGRSPATGGDGAAGDGGLVTEADLSALPRPVAEYVRRSGAVGRPRVTDFHATVRGRIRGGPGKPWMAFTGEQFNDYGTHTRRLFRMDATMFGLPVDILHLFDRHATMRARILSVFRIVDASGPDMDRAETVTVFNDLCVMAPAALVGAPVTWRAIDDHRAEGTFTKGDQTVTAKLIFNAEHDLVDFVSDDRLRSSPDGKSFVRQRWSTPLDGYQETGGRRCAARGLGMWHAPEPEGRFSYLEFELVGITYNVGSPADPSAAEGGVATTAT